MSTDEQAQSQSQDDLKRQILFQPCKSKAQLHRWIRIFLDLDIPDCIVDPESNSSPMDMIYETYSKALENNDPKFDRVLYYASRDSFKTLGAAILEVLSVVHLGRSVAHMAAIESQSRKSQQYVKKFLGKAFLREYVVGDNQEITWFVRYEHKETGENLNEGQFNSLSEADKNYYDERRYYIRIVICTMAGANSEHVPLFVIDEVDVVRDHRAYEDAQLIPAPYEGKEAITLLTSTRKFSFGLVQKEIDNAQKSGLQIRHWNLIDVTKACPAERHLPDQPRLPIYVADEDLKAVEEEEFKGFTPEEQLKYVKYEGYAGCMKNCAIFAACKGRLATKQTSKSELLKSIAHTTNTFKKVSIPTARAQLLCRKPSTEGLIYPSFNKEVHLLTAAQMAEKITGEKFDPSLTRIQLIQLMKQWDLRFFSGMDFGYTHMFAVPTGAVDGYRAFIFDVISEAELEPSQQVETCRLRFKALGEINPSIFADPENPQMIKVLKKAHFRMRDWKKGPGSVAGGIDAVRMKLRPTMGEPQLFLLKDDPGCELLAQRLSQYHWKLDAAGRITNVPDEEDDDECDGLRYFIMNVFAPKGSVKTSKDQAPTTSAPTKENWFQKALQDHAGPGTQLGEVKGRSGGLKWDLG